MLFFPLIPSWAKTLQPSPAPSTVCSTRVLIRAWRGLLSKAAHVTHPFTPQRAHTLTHTNMHTREPWRSCVWEQWCVSLIGFINFSQMTLLLRHFLLKRLYFLILCHFLLVVRYHYEQILKRYEQSKPTFTDSNKNIASLSGENGSVILFMTPCQFWSSCDICCWNHGFCFWNLLNVEGCCWIVDHHFDPNISAHQLVITVPSLLAC